MVSRFLEVGLWASAKKIVAFVRNVAVIELGGWAIGLTVLVVDVGTGIAGRSLFGAQAGLGIGLVCGVLAGCTVCKRLPRLSTET